MTSPTPSYITGRLFVFLGLGLLVGWLLGQPVAGVLAVTLTYLFWSHRQLLRLIKWLDEAAEKEVEPPESAGIWGDIFDGIHRVQRQHKRSKRRLTNVIERIQDSTAALDDGVVMADKHGNLEWWNRAAGELLSLQTPHDQGQQLTNLVRDPLFVDYLENSSERDPIQIIAPANANRQLQIAITLYGSGNRLLLVRDVTRLHQLETMRKDFVANVSHELRTPLTVISGYVETLIESGVDLPPLWNKALNRMQEQTFRMQNLVSDLLLLSRLEATEPEDDSNYVHLKPLLSGIVDDTRALSGENEHQVVLECDEEAAIVGDSGELRSAFANLAYNAVRYTPMGGRIKIRWKQDTKGGHLTIKDNGVGIDPVHIPRLTERFYRVDRSRSNSTGGTGLGLAIVKHVLLRHGGEISISSHPGKGSSFVCHFPKNRLVKMSDARNFESIS